jgi:S1-C subfamily serine protease
MTLRRGLPWFLLVLLLAGIGVAWPYVEQRASRRAVSDVLARLETERLDRSALEREIAERAQRLATYAQDVRGLLDTHRDQVGRIERAVRTLEAERTASERIIGTYASGVPLIQGVVVYEDRMGRALRYIDRDVRGRTERGLFGSPRMSAEGTGPIVRTTFLGTGLLVSRDGAVLTGRHVVRPWDAAPEVMELLEEQGVTPRVSQLRAFFPGVPDPVPLSPVKAAETTDLLVLHGKVPRSVPVLPLDRRERDAVPGRPVIALGYPTGLDLLLARVDPALLETLVDSSVTEISDETVDIPELLERLSRLKQIRPYPTWGRLADWQAHQLAHDAATSVGGSGGPIFATSGLVIGLTTATVRDLDGAALGVPIRAAFPLLGAKEGRKRLVHTSWPARGPGR